MKLYTIVGSTSYGDYISDYIICNHCWKSIDMVRRARNYVEAVFDQVLATDDVGYIIDCMNEGKSYSEVAEELRNNPDTYIPEHDDWYLNFVEMKVDDNNGIMATE